MCTPMTSARIFNIYTMDYKSHHLTSSILSCGRYENGPANVATSVLKHAHT